MYSEESNTFSTISWISSIVGASRLDCFSLTKSPDLPAKTLAAHCYDHMFYSCIYLKSIKIGYTGNYDSTYFDHWVTNVATSGTFYYNGDQTAQDFQLPSGWTTEKF